jgi:hypothetical protein
LAALLVSDVDVLSAARHRDAERVLHAAEGALEFVIDELSLVPDWNGPLSGATHSRLRAALVLPAAAGGVVLDAVRVTLALQRASFASAWGTDTPEWQLFAHGNVQTDLPLDVPGVYVLVWVADDVGESDGNPAADSNGTVVIRARAIGPRKSTCDVQAVASRTSQPGVVRVLSRRVWR